jgi:hypothetical protein
VSYEGYIGAQILVDGIKRASVRRGGLTRDNLRASFESLGDYNIGDNRDMETADFNLHWSPANHNGAKYTRLAMLTYSGRVVE